MCFQNRAAIGFYPAAEYEKQRVVPTFKEFVYQQYLPYAKTYKRSWDQDQNMIELR
ncbi:hypothetical protein [Desulfonatronospira thiodismutans]|uniref:hypothetical protein n=1 Tax=Desulfonatronospira thiodismutans TaxID=488939 RepID=UPI0002E5CE70|nr:hypothetical protein [Desulfonatronospira thiodismutans]